MNIFIAIFLYTLLCKILFDINIVYSYYVTVNIDRRATNSDRTYMITNKKTDELCPDGYSKYITERPDCFSVGAVRFRNESIKINESEIVLHYVYGIESYWKYNTPIMIRFIKYHGWYTRVYPAYVLTKSGKWKQQNTYYYDKEITKGKLRLILDDVAAEVNEIIESDKNKEKEDEGEVVTREFKLFEGDKLRKKNLGSEATIYRICYFFYRCSTHFCPTFRTGNREASAKHPLVIYHLLSICKRMPSMWVRNPRTESIFRPHSVEHTDNAVH